jgi:hypothetical protein
MNTQTTAINHGVTVWNTIAASAFGVIPVTDTALIKLEAAATDTIASLTCGAIPVTNATRVEQ